MTTSTIAAVEWVVIIAGLLSSLAQQNHCSDLRPGYGRTLRNLRATRGAITSKQAFLPRFSCALSNSWIRRCRPAPEVQFEPRADDAY